MVDLERRCDGRVSPIGDVRITVELEISTGPDFDDASRDLNGQLKGSSITSGPAAHGSNEIGQSNPSKPGMTSRHHDAIRRHTIVLLFPLAPTRGRTRVLY
jgi:hypothetical protein